MRKELTQKLILQEYNYRPQLITALVYFCVGLIVQLVPLLCNIEHTFSLMVSLLIISLPCCLFGFFQTIEIIKNIHDIKKANVVVFEDIITCKSVICGKKHEKDCLLGLKNYTKCTKSYLWSTEKKCCQVNKQDSVYMVYNKKGTQLYLLAWFPVKEYTLSDELKACMKKIDDWRPIIYVANI